MDKHSPKPQKSAPQLRIHATTRLPLKQTRDSLTSFFVARRTLAHQLTMEEYRKFLAEQILTEDKVVRGVSIPFVFSH